VAEAQVLSDHARVRSARLVAAVMVLVACEAAPIASPSATPTIAPIPTATASPTARPAPSPTASPTPQPTARPGVRATPAGAIPESFRYVAIDLPIADGFHTRLWLVDLNATRAPLVVAEWEGPASPVGGYSVSADGRSVLISAAGSRSRAALFLLRPETGTTVVLFEEPGTIVISAKIAPDGMRFAFTKYPADGGSDLGIWSGLTAGGDLRQIAERSVVSNVPLMPLAWSTDSVWLAFTHEQPDRSEVRLAHREGGVETVVGPGDKASWRGNPPELLVALSATPSSRVYTYDIATRKTIEVVKVDKLLIPVIQWHPSLDRFVYVESEGAGREASGGIWIRNADGTGASRLDLGRAVFAPQWSRDGTLLSALAGGDDATVTVVELFSGRRITVLCRRGGTPPADCV
jgi:Tol biopolymer transport system component